MSAINPNDEWLYFKEPYKRMYNMAMEDCSNKLDELERAYPTCSKYDDSLLIMYADIYTDFRKWLKEQIKEQSE